MPDADDSRGIPDGLGIINDADSLAEAIQSEEGCNSFVEWFSGIQDYSQEHASTSLLLLNAVRDACRPFFEEMEQDFRKAKEAASFEDDFPVLGKKPKRRVRPALVQVSGTAAWGGSKGNLTNLPFTKEDKGPNDAVMRRAVHVTPTKTKASANPVSISPRKLSLEPMKAVDEMDESRGRSEVALLVSVYCCLFRYGLLPSTMNEFHLLFRILNLKKSSLQPSQKGLGRILRTSSRCVYFATESLRANQTYLIQMGPVLWKPLSQCELFRKHLPDVFNDIESRLAASTFDPLLPVVQQTALFTIPFKAERDSRHNFRSRKGQTIFKNREETRDAFLRELHTFLHARGSIEKQSAEDRLKKEGRNIIDSLLNDNLAWFAEFWADLLLQVGLVPLQETDEDIVNMLHESGKDKLQKLHQRLTSKPSRKKNSHRLVENSTRIAFGSSDEARVFFPGHQDFFFLFIVLTDSLRFGLHLRRVLVATLRTKLEGEASDIEQERTLLELRMLGRFIGLLFFHQNWSCGDNVGQEFVDGFLSLRSDGIDCENMLNEAIKESSWITVCWIVELLRMAAWDCSSSASSVLHQLVCRLWQVQERLLRSPDKMLLVSMCIEHFFSECVGLSRLCKLHGDRIQSQGIPQHAFANVGFRFLHSQTLFVCVPYSEELVSLVSCLAKKDNFIGKSPGVSRKLRPSMISPSKSPTDLMSNRKTQPVNIQTKLADSFFHRQSALKDICDCTIRLTLASCASDDFLVAFQNQSSYSSIQKYVEMKFSTNLESAISTYALPSMDNRVKSMALKLAQGKGVLLASDVIAQLESKVLAAQSSIASTTTRLFEEDNPMQVCAVEIDRFARKIFSAGFSQQDVADLLPTLDRVQNIFATFKIPKEDDARKLYEAVFVLDDALTTYIESACVSATIVNSLLEVSLRIDNWSTRGLFQLKNCLNDVSLARKWICRSSNEIEEAVDVLKKTFQSGYMARNTLDRLLQGEKDDFPELIIVELEKLHSP